MQKILLADDDDDARLILRERLEREGFSVIEAENGDRAFFAAIEASPDLVISDVSMPGGDGLALCRRLKAHPATAGLPVILLSGVHRGEEDQIFGLERGADDYLLKPYSHRLLLAKARALLRRGGEPGGPAEVLAAGSLRVDSRARIVSAGGRRIALTRKEFDLLALLLRRRGQALRAGYLLETVWGYDPADYDDPHTLQSHVSTLRRKLGPGLGGRIVNVSGVGYRFESEAEI